jgi:predicted unusual protein kinase regulating ubiquinone biosynthesis (AarF/ABC1/UbiB family)
MPQNDLIKMALFSFRSFVLSMIITLIGLFLYMPSTSAASDVGSEQALDAISKGVEKIQEMANLTTQEQKQLVNSLLQQYKGTLEFIIKTNGSAAEKRARVQNFIDSIEKTIVGKIGDLRAALENVDISELRKSVDSTPQIEKVISRQNARMVIDVIGFLKTHSANVPEFEKRIHLLASVLNDVIDLWGTNVYNALSTDPQERLLGRQGLVNDIYYFKREYSALIGIIKIMMDSDNFQKMKPQHMSDLAMHIQSLGLLFIKFAQSASNVAIPIMKAQAKSEKTGSENVIALQKTISKLEEFQDGLPPISAEYAESVIKQEIEKATGKKKKFLVEILKNMDFNHPLKSGTIGTTYQVKVPVTRDWIITKTSHDDYYIVKIARPSLREEIEHGQKIFKTAMTMASALFPSFLQWIPKFVTSCFDSVSISFQDETNFAKEAVNMRRFKMLLMLSSVKVPAVNFASESLLVMESVTDGENFDAFIEREKDEKYMEFLKETGEIENRYYATKELKLKALEDFYATHPVEKQKLETFTQLYGEFLEGTVYMILAMGQVHADLHPGNILVKKHKGNHKLYFIDWGNTVDIDGLIMDPAFLVAYMALGNSKEIAHRLYNLKDSNSKVSEEQIHKIVTQVMLDNKLDAKGKTILKKLLEFISMLRQEASGNPTSANTPAVSAGVEQSAEERSKTMSDVGSQIIMRLLKETDFVMSGKYLQFFRTILPVGSTTGKIASALPLMELLKQSLKSANKGFLLGYLKSLILKHPAQMRSLIDEIKYGVNEKSDYLERSTEQRTRMSKDEDPLRLLEKMGQGVAIRCEDLAFTF